MYKLLTLSFAALALIGGSAHAQAGAPANDAVYQAMGQQEGIKRIVASFVKRVRTDPRVAFQFKDADLDRLHKMLFEQFCNLSGGPCKYTGQDMKESHADMKATNAQFNAVAENLQLAMEEHGVPSHAQNKLIAKLAPMQRDIVTK
ncbi:MAG TPA: group 1 truncated hemoglobin [Burkholderiaceae bacterium]